MNEILKLNWNGGDGAAQINISRFFPTSKARIKKLLKLIREDDIISQAGSGHIRQVVGFLYARTDEDEAKEAALSKDYWRHQQKYAQYRDQLGDGTHPNGLPLTKDERKRMREDMRAEKKFMGEALREAKKTRRRVEKTLGNINFIMEVTGNVIPGVCEDK